VETEESRQTFDSVSSSAYLLSCCCRCFADAIFSGAWTQAGVTMWVVDGDSSSEVYVVVIVLDKDFGCRFVEKDRDESDNGTISPMRAKWRAARDPAWTE
jgi:hypothetical protein